jgi:hypothetical protein
MAVKLFEMKHLCSGQAALLAGIDRAMFLMRLSEQGVAMIDLPPEELADDVRHAGPKRPGNQHRSRFGAMLSRLTRPSSGTETNTPRLLAWPELSYYYVNQVATREGHDDSTRQ